ncbi:MAG: toll/interleukin-1 receptor domain-containing protein [Rhodospirillaceae bacterium]|nr:toll/interleukin-1 receptor domain-containing protein [Rhodospirillaceae bacterium]
MAVIDYITKSELRNFANDLTFDARTTLRKSAKARSPAGATFLSHSSKDDDLVVGAIRVLEGHGATVYVDEIDPAMPPYTTRETAALLKTRIRQTGRFVLLASQNSKDSRWVPWELGIADGYKGMDSIAIFPAAENSYGQSWASWEYLGLYRKIVWGDHSDYDKRIWMVLDEKAYTATELSRWLRGG